MRRDLAARRRLAEDVRELALTMRRFVGQQHERQLRAATLTIRAGDRHGQAAHEPRAARGTPHDRGLLDAAGAGLRAPPVRRDEPLRAPAEGRRRPGSAPAAAFAARRSPRPCAGSGLGVASVAGSLPLRRGASVPTSVSLSSPRMNASTRLNAMSSWIWLRRALHEVARRRDERALQAAIEAQLQAADGVGDDAGAVGAVPDLELELGVERHVTVGRALHADVAPLAVEQPRHVVARADVDVVRVELVVEHRGDGVGLADLLGLEALALEHVQEVGVAAEVELVGAVEADAAIHEQAGQHAVA